MRYLRRFRRKRFRIGIEYGNKARILLRKSFKINKKTYSKKDRSVTKSYNSKTNQNKTTETSSSKKKTTS